MSTSLIRAPTHPGSGDGRFRASTSPRMCSSMSMVATPAVSFPPSAPSEQEHLSIGNLVAGGTNALFWVVVGDDRA